MLCRVNRRWGISGVSTFHTSDLKRGGRLDVRGARVMRGNG